MIKEDAFREYFEGSHSHKTFRKSLKSPFRNITVLEIWSRENDAIEEEERYDVDEEIKLSDLGLFDKSMSGEELMLMKRNSRLTLLGQARKIFLDLYCAKKRPPTKSELVSSLVPDFSRMCMNALSIRQNMTQEVSLTLEPKYFDLAVAKSLEDVPSHLSGWIDEESAKALARELKNKFDDGEYDELKNKLVDRLKTSMDNIAEDGRLLILNGRPGTGKSTEAAKRAKEYDKRAILTLSNTIGNMFAIKCPGIDRYSCTKARYCFKHGHYDCIVFDEASQFGLETIDLLCDVFEKNPKAMFIIMGDIDQTPTFLSSGSVLYSIMKRYPQCTKNLTTQFRFMNNPGYRDVMESVVKSEIPEGIQIDSMTEELIKNTDCYITGANASVDFLNKLCLYCKNPELSQSLTTDTKRPDLGYALMMSKNPTKIPIIANSTAKLKSKSEEYKLYVNTRFSFSHMIGDRYCLINQVDKSTVTVSRNQLNAFFVLGYAITVNKSQGLEWPRICVYVTSIDRNLKNFNAMYVALSRGMDALILATDKNGSFSKEDLKNILDKRYTFVNFFEN